MNIKYTRILLYHRKLGSLVFDILKFLMMLYLNDARTNFSEVIFLQKICFEKVFDEVMRYYFSRNAFTAL